jgi:O-antigen ligase
LEKHTLLRILKIFFRATFIYIFISIIYWFYNFSCFDVSLKSWVTSKIAVGPYPVYDFVGKWANYVHPSYISLILFCALISGFYLFYRKEKGAEISLFELVVYVFGCLSLELILESRIGIVEVLIITFVSLLYYAKIKSFYFKGSVIAILAAIISLYVVSENHFNKMMGDNVRKADYTLAIHYIHDHPWWGIGYQGQAKAIKMQDEIMKDVTRPITAPPVTYTHNQFLGDMVQFGIPGLIVLLVLLAGLVSFSIKKRNYLLQMFLLIYLIFMFIEEPLYVQEGITRFTIFLCFFVALIESDNPRKSFDLRNLLSKG